ncbi:MAG TPA: hypothetical protein VG406_04960 [Isosphaeraceae bacterium]|jgi:hypothetical protein|nr:hypothetical protein [Isosphaeraceae bacterium]
MRTCASTGGAAARPDAFERLVRLLKDNERLVGELKDLGDKLLRARAYRADPGCNVALAEAHINRLRAKHSGVLALLRANRIEAHELTS